MIELTNDLIRFARALDAVRIKFIAQAAYSKYRPRIGRNPAPMDANFLHHIENDTVFVLGHNMVIGYAVVLMQDDGYWLDNIAIDPDESGKGWGTLLIEHVETYLCRKTDYYQLYTNAIMVENQAWYTKLGFAETHRSSDSGFDRIYYKKFLRQQSND